MTNNEMDLVRSEIATLERFLERLPKSRVIERKGFEHRLKKAKKRLQELSKIPQPKKLPITFRGRPVDGIHSIDASFALNASKAFLDALDAVAAGLVSDDLKNVGPFPSTSESLRITGTVLGSFGFGLELPPSIAVHQQGSLFKSEETCYERAIKSTLGLLQSGSSGDEEAISDLVAEVHPRAVKKIRAFAKVLFDHGAYFSAEFEGKRAELERDEQVQRIITTLNDDDISEKTELLEGTILGILPESRRFEAKLANGQIINGKIKRTLEIETFKQRWDGKFGRMKLWVVRVRDRQRFELLGAESPDDPAKS